LPTELLIEAFFESIDPTSINRQGNDIGSQYRSGIYYTDMHDVPIIESKIEELQQHFSKSLAIEVEPLDGFYPAEKYHQDYLDKNPNGYCHINIHTADEFVKKHHLGKRTVLPREFYSEAIGDDVDPTNSAQVPSITAVEPNADQ
ncbi:MAG: peptide-methionine (S)-S-oxide reductase, partial [Raoultibacter sp.]